MPIRKNPLPPVEELRRLFSYDPMTGWLTRLVSVGRAKVGDMAGTDDGYGYLVTSINGTLFRNHRIAYKMQHGELHDDLEIDHINGIKDDNCAENLRPATRRQNCMNESELRHTNNSGYLGVSWDKTRKMWLAQRNIGGERKNLGRFATKEEASEAYKRSLAIDPDIDYVPPYRLLEPNDAERMRPPRSAL